MSDPGSDLASDPTWTQFRADAFGDPYMVWHDGPDFSVFRERWAEDPELATRMLVRGVAESDQLAARTIRELDLTPEQRVHFAGIVLAASMLQRGSARVAACATLFALTGDTAAAEGIVEELATAPFWTDRMEAALALPAFLPAPPLVIGVAEAVATDAEYLVRYHASNTLLGWAGLPADIHEHEQLSGLLSADDPAGWRQVADDLTARVPGAAEGAP